MAAASESSNELSPLQPAVDTLDLSVWYDCTAEKFAQLGGNGLLNRTNGSFVKILKESYPSVNHVLLLGFPDHHWEEWRFTSTQRRFWSNQANQKAFFDSIAVKFGIKYPEDWYSITTDHIAAEGGRFMMSHVFGGSLYEALLTLYPDHEWVPWKFAKTPQRFWSDPVARNDRRFFDWLGQQLSYSSLEDYYSISQDKMRQFGGGGLLGKHKSSVYACLCAAYPEHRWLKWKFSSRHTWNNQTIRQEFLDWVAEKKGFTNTSASNSPPEGWYSVSANDVDALGGSRLLTCYGPLPKLLSSTFPQWKWEMWRFEQAPRLEFHPSTNMTPSQRSQLKSCIRYATRPVDLDGMAHSLNVSTLEDWYRISWKEVAKTPLVATLRQWGSLHEVLSAAYPNHKWDKSKFSLSTKKSRQRAVVSALKTVLPQVGDLVEDYKFSAENVSETTYRVELDVYIPSLNLAFEIDGEHHFLDVKKVREQEAFAMRDSQKHAMCIRKGITLLSIPYDADISPAALASLIATTRPDLQLK